MLQLHLLSCAWVAWQLNWTWCQQLKGSVKERNKFHIYETEKITRKASDVAEYIELFGSFTEIVMHDAFNVILWTSADICVVVHDDLGWKNRATHCNRFWRALCSRLEYVDIHLAYQPNLTNNILKHLKSDTPLPPVNRTSETVHDWVMGGKKKYINIFGSFTEPFNCILS